MELLPNDHKAKWFAGAALNTAEQSMASVMSTALSRLNSFLDSELEQLLCFDTEIDAEKFCNKKSAIFVIMPEENPVTYFMISLIIQQLYREILAVADENKGKLKNRCIFFCDEFGTLPKIESAEMMKAADEKMYRWTWLGEPVGVDELIYYMFSDRHRQKPEEGRRYDRVYIGGDYGQQNATTYQAFGIDMYQRKLTGLTEYYHSGRDTGRQRSPSDYAQDLIGLMEDIHRDYGTRAFYIYLDPSAKGLQEEIRRAAHSTSLDYSVLIRDAENDVALGISRVQKTLTFEVMTIAPAQKNLIREMGLYQYDKKSIEKGKEIPIKEDDHCCDAMRYAVMGAWKYIKYWLPADMEEKHYEVDITKKEMEEDGYF